MSRLVATVPHRGWPPYCRAARRAGAAPRLGLKQSCAIGIAFPLKNPSAARRLREQRTETMLEIWRLQEQRTETMFEALRIHGPRDRSYA